MPNYLEFEVTLRGATPKIWRRFLLREKATFLDLHEAIQDAAQWWNYHLFVFRSPKTGEELAGVPSDEDMEGTEAPDAADIKVAPYFKAKGMKSCLYEYDFGDSWYCDVKLVQEVYDAKTFKRRLLGGERAFPHEDCGGMDGYERCAEFVKTGKDPWGDDSEGLKEWLGEWEPEKFDFQNVKKYFDKGKHVPIPGER